MLATNAEHIRSEILSLLETTSVKIAGWTTLLLDLSAAKMVDSQSA